MKKTILLLTGLLFLTFFTITSEAVIWNSEISAGDMRFDDQTINFGRLFWNNDTMTFNNTCWSISSTHIVNITITYLHGDVVNASDGSSVLAFDASTNTGTTVAFTITGFAPGENYKIYRNSVYYTQVTANSTGVITFSNSAWSEKHLIVQHGTYSGSGSPAIDNATNTIIETVIPLIVGIVFFAVLVTMLFAGVLTKETLIAWLLAFFVAMVVIITVVGL